MVETAMQPVKVAGLREPNRSRIGILEFVAVMLATAVLCLAFLALAAADATFSGRSERGFARSPVVHQNGSAGSAKAAWRATFDTVGGRQFSVIFIEPLVEGAPLPPGVPRWPQPGEAVLSPALIQAGSDEEILTRYGRVVGEIGRPGLSVPGEKLAYVRPLAGLEADLAMQPIDGYGSADWPPIGDSLTVRPERDFQLLLVGSLLVPAAVLLLVAVRIGAVERRPSLIGAAGPAVLAGAALALVAGTLAATVDVTLPLVNYVLAGGDLREGFWRLLGGWLLAVLLAGATVRLSAAIPVRAGQRAAEPGPDSAAQPGSNGSQRPQVRLAVLFLILLFVAVRGPDLFAAGTWARLLTNYVATAGLLLTLPAVCGLVTAAVGEGLTGVGRSSARPGPLASGQWMLAHPGVIARSCAGIVLAFIVLIQAQVWFGHLAEPVRDAKAVHAELGNSVQVVDVFGEVTPAQYTSFLTGLPASAQPLRLVSDATGQRLEVVGRCPALQSVRLPCTTTARPITGTALDRRLSLLLGWYAVENSTVTSRSADPATVPVSPDQHSVLVVTSADGSPVAAAELERAAFRSLPGGALVAPLAGEWLGSATLKSDQGRWVTLFGGIGAIILLTAGAIATLAEFLRRSSASTPVGLPSGNLKVVMSSATWSILLPVALAGITGTVIGLWLTVPMIGPGSDSISGPVILSYVAASLLAGIVPWAWVVVSAARRSPTPAAPRR